MEVEEMMLRKLFMALVAVPFLLLGGCKGILEAGTADGNYVKAAVEIDPFKGKRADPNATSCGRAKLTLEKGQEFDGEAFDTDNDGQPDKFLPDEGQKTGFGVTDGRTWYEMKLE